MPRKSDNSYAGVFAYQTGGISGGGYAGKEYLADDGTHLVTTDLAGVATQRAATDLKHTQMLRYGQNVAVSESIYGASAGWIYSAAVCPTNSQIFAFSRNGKILRSQDKGVTIDKLSSYNGGALDSTWTHAGHHNMRLCGRHVEFDHNNPDRVAFGHPEKRALLCSNFTATTPTVTAISTLPVPVFGADNRFGTSFAFDRSTGAAFAFVNGSGWYKNTSGITNSFSAISGGPTTCYDMRAAGGVLWACDVDENVWKLVGTTWTQAMRAGGSEPVKGKTIAIRQGDPNSIVTCRWGGDITFTIDGGATWTFHSIPFAVDGGDQRWIGASSIGFMSAGMIEWESRSGVNRWLVTTGMGVFYLDNPPRTYENAATKKWKSLNDGLLQLLFMGGRFTPSDNFMAWAQDRPFWNFNKGKWLESPARHGPGDFLGIQHCGDMQFLEGNESFQLATAYSPFGSGPGLYKTANRGETWEAVPGNAGVYGGCALPFSTTQYLWVPTKRTFLPRVTTDSGTTWQTPTFRHTEGGSSVDMTGSTFHDDYYMKRQILVKVPGQANTAYLFCFGAPSHDQGIIDTRTQGLWKTTDGGLNFVRVYATRINAGAVNVDFFNARLIVANAAYPNALFWTIGNAEGPADPATGGLQPSNAPPKFSADGGATWNAMAGFQETHSLDVGPSDKLANGQPSNPFGWILAAGFRGGVRGLWLCKDFNPANASAATWTLDTSFPGGRDDTYLGVVASKLTPGRFALMLDAGGFEVREYSVAARAV